MSQQPLLHYSRQGQGQPLVILHGLFGSGSNWGSHAKWLAERYDVILPDLRNHGRSFHAPDMAFPTMAGDVLRLLDALELESVLLLGHSMGGKTAMTLALQAPQRVRALVVADIAPIPYRRGNGHRPLIAAMRQLDLSQVRSRTDASNALADAIPSPSVRQFLLTNLQRGAAGYYWRIPLDILADQLEAIEDFPDFPGTFTQPTLFLYGEASDYVTADAQDAIRRYFPNARLHGIAGAGHWLHAEQPQAFASALGDFLDRLTA